MAWSRQNNNMVQNKWMDGLKNRPNHLEANKINRVIKVMGTNRIKGIIV
jgi:hypothetical protein